MPSPFVPETARNISTQADFILVERTINQNIEALLFWYFPKNLSRKIARFFVSVTKISRATGVSSRLS